MADLSTCMRERERLARDLDEKISEAGRAYAQFTEMNKITRGALHDAGATVTDSIISPSVGRSVLDVCLARAGLRQKVGFTSHDTMSALVASEHRQRIFPNG